MIKEQKFFLSIIKDYINGSKTEICEDIDWQKILDYAQSHQLTAIVHHQCKSFIPQSVFEAFKAYSFSTIYSNLNRKNITENTIDLLHENGVDCFLIKGFDIADYYPNWQYRTMGDTDIVVDDLENSHNILLDAGFRSRILKFAI